MNNTSESNNNLLQSVFEFHRVMQERRYILVYEGEVNQDITKAFAAMTEHRLEKEQEERKVKKKVFNVMVECLQNIAKHSDHAANRDNKGVGNGIFIVGSEGDDYVIITGNPILNDRIENVKPLLDRVNELDRDGVKELYKEAIKASKISDKGGAGLGFIDIAKKTGSKLIYGFEPIDDDTSFFLLKTNIKRHD